MKLRTCLGLLVGWMVSVVGSTSACSGHTCLDDGEGACDALGTDGADADASNGADGSADARPTDGDADADVVVPPDNCDPDADIKDSPACVDDAFGVFVDGNNGDDGQPGTKLAPKKSISAAFDALQGKSRIFVCKASYPEHLELTSSVSLFGGFDCASWNFSGDKPTVAPSSPGFALHIDNVDGVSVSDFDFKAPNPSAGSPSSVAIFVAHSSVHFARINATASNALDGASASTGSNFDPSLSASNVNLRGKPASGTSGGPQQDCLALCSNGVHATGGKGGNGSSNPSPGQPGLPNLGAGAGGAANANCAGVGTGGIGGPGDPASPASPPTSLGSLSESGWTPSDGPAGAFGSPGQGGGGGGGGADPEEGGGGGGGCGGCGGAPGSIAKGGGASIAIASFLSAIDILDSSLSANDAGNAGNGAPGQQGQVGGAGGTQAALGCQGGKGGSGGAGGASAGGAGGVSAAILFKGQKPSVSNSSLAFGSKGNKGTGGAPGSNDGIDGKAAEFLEAP